MKRYLSLLLACMLCLSLGAPATAESSAIGGADAKPFAPFEETVTIKAVGKYTASDEKRPSTCYWNDMLAEFLNVKVDWLWEVPDDQYNTKLSVTLASGNVPDMLNADPQTFSYLREAGALADLTEVWNEYASEPLKKAFTSKYLENVTFDGKLLAIPYPNNASESMNVMYYRTDWLENVGLDKPQSMDDFTAVIKAFRDSDPDGNGEKDTYGLAMTSDPLAAHLSYEPIFNAFGSYPTSWILRDGKLVHGLVQDETKAALDYLRGLYSEGYIDPEFATLSADQVKARLADGKLGILSDWWYASDDGHLMLDTMRSDPEARWEAQAMVGMEAGTPAKVKAAENASGAYMVVLNTASEEAMIAMVKMLNLFYDYNFSTAVEQGGAGHVYYKQKYSIDSEEYKAIRARWCAWCLPVYTWDLNANYNQALTLTHYYETGEWDDSLYLYDAGTKQSRANWIDALHVERSDVDESDEEVFTNWLTGQGQALTRIKSGDWEGSLFITTRLYNEGHVELNRYYGPETEAGNAYGATLNDMATEYINRYIMGMESEDSWETFVSTWNQMGGEICTQEVNDAYAKLH